MAHLLAHRHLLGVTLAALLVAACDTGPAPSLYDENDPSLADPVIESVSPNGSALAGVDVVTLTGSNFGATVEDNYVYFNGTRAEILSASATEIQVIPPNEPQTEISLRVSVIGAENFSNSITYALEAASERFSALAAFEEVFGVATDASGNVYLSLFSDGRSVGIKQVAPDGTRSDYIETTFKWDDMVFDDAGQLFAVRGVRALFRFPAGGGAQETYAVVPNTSVVLVTVDMDDAGNLWTAGNNDEIYKIAPDLTITGYPFVADVRYLRAVGSTVYVAASVDGVEGLWQLPIDGNGDLGAATQLFDLTQVSETVSALSLAVNSAGAIYLGTDHADPVLLVQPDGSWSPLYPGILSPTARALAWGTAPSLYMSQGPTEDTLPDLININTRDEGAP